MWVAEKLDWKGLNKAWAEEVEKEVNIDVETQC
jgi:hypothetical protein